MEQVTIGQLPHPLLVPQVMSIVLQHLIKLEDGKWDAKLAQLFELRRVCRLWRKSVDAILGTFDSLSLLPHPNFSVSRQFYMDSLHASLFHLTSSSIVGSPYYYNLFDKGQIINESVFPQFFAHFRNLKYLSIVDLNKDILNIINNNSTKLEGLAFDTVDETTVTDDDLKNCCFNKSLQLVSFSFFINRRWIVKFFQFFQSLEYIHFSSTDEPYVVPFELLYSTGPTVKAIYLGNRVATFDNLVNPKSDLNCLHSLEMLTTMTLYIHQQEFLLSQLSSFKFLRNLQLDLSHMQKEELLPLIGKVTSLSTLKLILPSGQVISSILPLDQMVNSELEQLVLVGNIKYPVVRDVQIGQLAVQCPKLNYLCVNALDYSVKNADEYMDLLRSLSYLKHLHLGYRPLLESIEKVRDDLVQLSHSFVTFKLIYWCNTGPCRCLKKDFFTIHSHYCNCSYNISNESKVLFKL